jgi:hypothetical protein
MRFSFDGPIVDHLPLLPIKMGISIVIFRGT